MDYKGQGQGGQEQAFFTAGAGSISPDKNNFESENNLDLTNETASWSTETIKQPQELVGKNILNTPLPNHEAGNGLGETIDADLPPTMQALPADPTPVAIPVFDEKLIRTEGDRIDKKALPEINNAIEKLDQTGNTADFYTTIRGDKDNPGMLGSNLKNSYGRELK